jgi:hypothetical protein
MQIIDLFILFLHLESTTCLVHSATPKDIVLGSVGVIMKDVGTITESKATWPGFLEKNLSRISGLNLSFTSNI